uniref:Placenta associated 9 n=3 Tax=Canidae TaxID=9608 RepID=A0A8C0TV76_CANLF
MNSWRQTQVRLRIPSLLPPPSSLLPPPSSLLQGLSSTIEYRAAVCAEHRDSEASRALGLALPSSHFASLNWRERCETAPVCRYANNPSCWRFDAFSPRAWKTPAPPPPARSCQHSGGMRVCSSQPVVTLHWFPRKSELKKISSTCSFSIYVESHDFTLSFAEVPFFFFFFFFFFFTNAATPFAAQGASVKGRGGRVGLGRGWTGGAHPPRARGAGAGPRGAAPGRPAPGSGVGARCPGPSPVRPRLLPGGLRGGGSRGPRSPEPPRNLGAGGSISCGRGRGRGRPGARPGADARCAPAGSMRPLLCALAGLALLRAAAAEPFVPSHGDPAWNTGCDRHMAVHDRLDVIEETVEKTVEHLEAEVKGLLGQLEELAWNLPPGPFSPTPDLLGDDHFGALEPEPPSSWK